MNVTSSTPGRNVLSFKLSGSEKMRIASDGSVGIGTAAPATTLDVSGTTTLKGTTNLSNNNIINIGNAGIGTAAPAYKLDVIGSGSDSIVCRLQSGGANTYTTYVNTGASNLDVGTGSGGHFIYGYGSYPLYFGVNGSEKMRITSAGNVGIGTSTPNAPLQLANTVANRKIVLYETGNNDHQYFGFGISSGVLRYQSDANHVFYSGTSSTSSKQHMVITSATKVGIGIDSPAYTLDVSGVIKYQNYYFRFTGINSDGIGNGQWVALNADTTTPYYLAGYTQGAQSAGRYTYFEAPINGIYHLSYTFNIAHGAAGKWYIGYIKSSAAAGPTGFTFSTSNWSGNANIFNTIAFENANWELINGTLAYNVKLNAGERVWVVVTNNQTGNPYQYSWGSFNTNVWTGYLVSAS